MSITVSHKEIDVAAGSCVDFLEGVYNFMVSSADFTIIDFDGIGANSGWFVFKMAGSTWECWMGANTTATDWHADNFAGLSSTDYIWYSLAPGGGWNSASDSPTISEGMFTNAPVNSGGYSAGVSIKEDGSSWATSSSRYGTLIYDKDDNFFALLADEYKNNIWNVCLTICKVSASALTTDLYPYIGLSGALYGEYSTGLWGTPIAQSTTYYSSAILNPSGTGPQSSAVFSESVYAFLFGNTGYGYSPNPVAGNYDWRQLCIGTATTPNAHMRGGSS